jgi:hypothetical protein
MIARNEDWIIGYSARAALAWCDSILILDHASTDRTPTLLASLAAEYPGRVHLHREEDPTWKEMQHRQFTLDRGRELGGTHFAIIDADEVLTSSLWVPFSAQERKVPTVRDHISHLQPGQVLEVPMIPVWRAPLQQRVDPCVWSNAYMPIAFADNGKMAWAARGGYDHHNRIPHPYAKRIRWETRGNGGCLHYQFADWERLTIKHIWYRMMETVRWPGRNTPAQLNAKYNQALDETGLKLAPIPLEFYSGYMDLLSRGLFKMGGGDTWHLQECRRMWMEHGPKTFEGLDLMGVVP